MGRRVELELGLDEEETALANGIWVLQMGTPADCRKQIPSKDDSRYRHHCLHHSDQRSRCEAAIELDGSTFLREACQLGIASDSVGNLGFDACIYCTPHIGRSSCTYSSHRV